MEEFFYQNFFFILIGALGFVMLVVLIAKIYRWLVRLAFVLVFLLISLVVLQQMEKHKIIDWEKLRQGAFLQGKDQIERLVRRLDQREEKIPILEKGEKLLKELNQTEKPRKKSDSLLEF